MKSIPTVNVLAAGMFIFVVACTTENPAYVLPHGTDIIPTLTSEGQVGKNDPARLEPAEPVDNTAESYARRGWGSTKKGNYDIAIADYTRAIELETDYAGAYILRAEAYRKMWQIRPCSGRFEQGYRIG